MTRDEFEIIWHDWLRGVVLIALVVAMAGLYLTKLLPLPVFATVLGVVYVLAGFVLIGRSCIAAQCGALVRSLSVGVALFGSAGMLLTLWQVHFPSPPFAQGTLSHVAPDLVLEVPQEALAEALLVVRGHPGASPSGADATVDADLVTPAAKLHVSLFHNRSGRQSSGGRGGLSLSLRTAEMFRFDGVAPGPFALHLASLKPEMAMPLQVSLHSPPVAMNVLTWVCAGALVAALLLSVFISRNGVFPGVVPMTAMMLAIQVVASKGYSPAEPILPLLGILALASIPAAFVGWLLARAVGLVFKREEK